MSVMYQRSPWRMLSLTEKFCRSSPSGVRQKPISHTSSRPSPSTSMTRVWCPSLAGVEPRSHTHRSVSVAVPEPPVPEPPEPL